MAENKPAATTSKASAKLNFAEMYSQSLGVVIGVGIISTSGIAIGHTGTGVWLSFIVAGLAFLVSYLPTLIGTSVVPRTSGTYFMVGQLGIYAKGIFAFIQLTSTISIGFMAASFSSYMMSLVNFGSSKFWSVVLLTVFFAVNLLDQKSVVKIQTVQNVILVLAWAAFLFFGLPHVEWSRVFSLKDMFPNGLNGFMTAVSLLMFSVCGATWLCDSGERIENPEKNIIRGNIANTATACLLFALITIVSSGVLPVEEVANQPLTNVAQYVFPGKWYLFFIIGGAIMAICTTVNGRFLGAANMLRRSALEGWYPEALARINKNDTPWVLLIGVYLLSVIPILLGVPMGVFASLMALFGTLTFLVSNLSFFALIKHYPEEWKNSRWHMSKPATIAMFIVSNGILVVYMIANLASYTSSIPTLVVAAVLCAAFVLARKKTVLRKTAELEKRS